MEVVSVHQKPSARVTRVGGTGTSPRGMFPGGELLSLNLGAVPFGLGLGLEPDSALWVSGAPRSLMNYVFSPRYRLGARRVGRPWVRSAGRGRLALDAAETEPEPEPRPPRRRGLLCPLRELPRGLDLGGGRDRETPARRPDAPPPWEPPPSRRGGVARRGRAGRECDGRRAAALRPGCCHPGAAGPASAS